MLHLLQSKYISVNFAITWRAFEGVRGGGPLHPISKDVCSSQFCDSPVCDSASMLGNGLVQTHAVFVLALGQVVKNSCAGT